MTYTQVFGGENIHPAQLAYTSYSISENLTLVWPYEAIEGSNVAADKIDIDASVAALTVTLPDADRTSRGDDILIRNTGAEAIGILDADGGTLTSIAAGEEWFFFVTNNSTAAGAWGVVQFGVSGGGGSTAASLAGEGLEAVLTRLRQNLTVVSLAGNYTVTVGDRAKVLRNSGGAAAYTFSSPSTLGDGFFVYVINSGTGSVVLSVGANTIDGSPTKTLAPGENCMIFGDATNLYTLGYGRSVSTSVTVSLINIAGAGNYSLSATQRSAQVQNFTGTLTGNRFVNYGGSVGYWFVSNETDGPFVLFLSAFLGGGGTIPVSQGEFIIVRSDGAELSVAFSSQNGTVTSVGTTAGELTGGPITVTGTLGLANTAVSPGTYGSASETLAVTVDSKGRLTAISEAAITVSLAQLGNFTSADFASHLTDETGTGLIVLNSAPTLLNPVVGTQAPTDNSTKAASTEFVTAAIADAIFNFAGGFATGDIKASASATEQSGWLFLSGKTIGSAASAATARANADTEDLFTFLWNNFNNTICPVSGGRGGSAIIDFNLNKTIQLLDGRGRVIAGADAMGGSAAGLLGGFAGGIAGAATPGASGGEQSHLLVAGELPSSFNTSTNSGLTGSGSGTLLQETGAGGNGPHNNTQPTLVLNYFIKL